MQQTLGILIMLSLLTGCGSTPKQPPEPNMSRLEPVNKSCPVELRDSCVMSVTGGQ